jgi:hypothetical protein
MFYRRYIRRALPIVVQLIVTCLLLLYIGSSLSADGDPRNGALTDYTISGRVTYFFVNDSFPNVVLVTNTGVTATTNHAGRFLLTGLAAGTYTITPTTTISGDTLIAFPASQEVTLPPTLENLNFSAEIVVADAGIAGQITFADGQPVDGVTLHLSSGSTVVTDEQGRYRFFPLAPGEYILWPDKPGYSFEPDVRTVNLPGDNGAQDFVAGIEYVINLPLILH